MQTYIIDIESYPNFFFIGVLNTRTGEKIPFGFDSGDRFIDFIQGQNAITFNGCGYDVPMLYAWLSDESVTVYDLYKLTQKIIKNPRGCPWELKNAANEWFNGLVANHADLMLFLNKRIGLKAVGINIGTDKVQDLPYPFDEHLTEERKINVARYCFNDCLVTRDLYNHPDIRKTFALRKLINQKEPFSKSTRLNAYQMTAVKIAENIMLDELRKRNGGKLPPKIEKPIDVANCLRLVPNFKQKEYRDFYNRVKSARMTKLDKSHMTHLSKKQREDWDNKYFYFDEVNGYYSNVIIDSHNKQYTYGLGGLHSKDNYCFYKACLRYILRNVDVKSYYPNMIVQFKIEMYNGFAATEKDYIKHRYVYRDRGDTLESTFYKLVLNSLFGKMNDKWSKLCCANSAFSVTITGQFLLLWLIDMVQSTISDTHVVNANTDGVCFKLPADKEGELQKLCREWERVTGLELDTDYVENWIALGCNEYLATLKTDKGTKLKTKGGRLSLKPALDGATNASIVPNAIYQHLVNGVDVLSYIKQNATLQNVMISSKCKKGYNFYGGEKVQKSVRYFHSCNGKQINDGFGKLIAKRATLALDITELKTVHPANLFIDHALYAEKVHKIIADIKAETMNKPNKVAPLEVINATVFKPDYNKCLSQLMELEGCHLYPCKTPTSGYKGVLKKDIGNWFENDKIKGTDHGWRDALMYQIYIPNEFVVVYSDRHFNEVGTLTAIDTNTGTASMIFKMDRSSVPHKDLKKYGLKGDRKCFVTVLSRDTKLVNKKVLNFSTFLKSLSEA